MNVLFYAFTAPVAWVSTIAAWTSGRALGMGDGIMVSNNPVLHLQYYKRNRFILSLLAALVVSVTFGILFGLNPNPTSTYPTLTTSFPTSATSAPTYHPTLSPDASTSTPTTAAPSAPT